MKAGRITLPSAPASQLTANKSTMFHMLSCPRGTPPPTCTPLLPSRPLQTQFKRTIPSSSASHTATSTPSTAPPTTDALNSLLRWCIEQHNLPACIIEPTIVEDELDPSQPAIGFACSLPPGTPASKGDILLEIPADLAITSVDVAKDPLLSVLAEGRSELVGLALFLMKERGVLAPSSALPSQWAPLLATLPEAIDTPVLWPDDERQALLKGSPVLEEARARERALDEEWESIVGAAAAAAADVQLDGNSSLQAFKNAMSVVLATASYLPSAQCFALLPVIGALRRTGSAAGAVLDYDVDRQSVVLSATRPYTRGQEVRLYDGRPNGEILLATGRVEPTNPNDFLMLPAALVPADRLYSQKRSILEAFEFGPTEEFPIYEDRMATQHLAYMRLARLTDPAQIAKITFDQDVIVSPENEYEVLQLIMSDLRDRNQAYDTQYEEDLKELQRRDLQPRERVALALKVGEKRVVRGTMDGVRRRLAPIRGIPSKAGNLQDPNADFKEMFDTIEGLPSAPKRFLDGLTKWARGDYDDEFTR